MLFNEHKSFSITERSYINRAKKEITQFASDLAFTEEQKGKIDIIISELASNLIKHNTLEGEILVKSINEKDSAGIEIISVDNGPGVSDVHRIMEDGMSTFGSKGEGLGAIKRLSDEFDIYSQAGTGTFILARLFVKNKKRATEIRPRRKPEVQAVMVAKPGETICGDGWAKVETGNNIVVLAADGLGHGIAAHQASEEAINVFTDCMQCQPSDVLQLIHNSIKHTRGIVGGLANIDYKNKTITYCGIGNISGRIFSNEGTKSLVSYNGTIGYNIPNHFNDHHFQFGPASIMILHSDGVKTRWNLAKYTGIERHDASLIAAVLYKDNTRKTDDSLVLVVKV